MDEYWDSNDQWADEGRCPVCGSRSEALVCSASCEDIVILRENDCYA